MILGKIHSWNLSFPTYIRTSLSPLLMSFLLIWLSPGLSGGAVMSRVWVWVMSMVKCLSPLNLSPSDKEPSLCPGQHWWELRGQEDHLSYFLCSLCHVDPALFLSASERLRSSTLLNPTLSILQSQKKCFQTWQQIASVDPVDRVTLHPAVRFPSGISEVNNLLPTP